MMGTRRTPKGDRDGADGVTEFAVLNTQAGVKVVKGHL